MKPEKLPPLWALDMAAAAVGKAGWSYFEETATQFPDKAKTVIRPSVIAHARTLAKYEKPPVDEAEMKRRQDAREATVAFWDSPICIQAAYIALCHRDGVTPTPVEEWGQ